MPGVSATWDLWCDWFEGDSLSEFAVNWVRWLIHRRTLYRSDTPVPEAPEKPMKAVSGMSDLKQPEQLGIKIKEKPKKAEKAQTCEETPQSKQAQIISCKEKAASPRRGLHPGQRYPKRHYRDYRWSLSPCDRGGADQLLAP